MNWSNYLRKTPRLDGWDYASSAWHFVTICTFQHQCFLGTVDSEAVQLSAMGGIARDCWLSIPDHISNAYPDEFVVMPNHVHGIITLDDACQSDIAGKNFAAPTSGSLGHVIGTYKSAVTRLCRARGYDDFRWQPKYFDHIIRNDKSLMAIRQYINTNPQRWGLEKKHPDNIGEVW
ncbi:MAG: transposase [Bacillota bacterium]|nr:transposase [Bacillota bacterium]